MEIKATLNKPYTEDQRVNFIVGQNHRLGYEIRENEAGLEAWGVTAAETKERERQRLDNLTLTPADVERALYKAKQMDFDDLIAMIEENMTGVDIKALRIEFKASLFYRGAKLGDNKMFNVIGNLLGYNSDDMDYLFEHKELPEKGSDND